MEVCRKLSHPDDVSLGAVIECLLGYKLTEVPEMLSHVEILNATSPNSLKDMVCMPCTIIINVMTSLHAA